MNCPYQGFQSRHSLFLEISNMDNPLLKEIPLYYKHKKDTAAQCREFPCAYLDKNIV